MSMVIALDLESQTSCLPLCFLHPHALLACLTAATAWIHCYVCSPFSWLGASIIRGCVLFLYALQSPHVDDVGAHEVLFQDTRLM